MGLFRIITNMTRRAKMYKSSIIIKLVVVYCIDLLKIVVAL